MMDKSETQYDTKVKDDFEFLGALEAHKGWVTAINASPEQNEFFVSASRDKKLILWRPTDKRGQFATPVKSLSGHNHYVSDVQISHNSAYAISSSWDKTLRLWDLQMGTTVERFVGHAKEVLSVSFSPMNSRQIVSGSSDRVIKLWNTLADCKINLVDKGHTDWVTCVRFSPNPSSPLVVSCGSDRLVKAWEMTDFSLKTDYHGHSGYLNVVTISPDGSLCASGGKDGNTMLWDLIEDKLLYSLDTGDVINALAFSPSRYWLCTASGAAVKVWDLEAKKIIAELTPGINQENKYSMGVICTSLSWFNQGRVLLAGYSDGMIRVWRNSTVTNCI